MKVEVDEKSGFCFGVQNAVEIAEQALRKGEIVYSLGPIVHNDMEVKRLESLGLISIDYDKFRKLSNCNVLVRAHGEPPETYRLAKKNNITIIEATCPIVKNLQKRIRNNWTRIREEGGQVVIFGKPGHAEVVGLLGQTNNEGILIAKPDDIEKIDLSRPVALYSQTTMEINEFKQIKDLIHNRMLEEGKLNPETSLKVVNSVCGQVSNREPHLRNFAGNHDMIIFVSGKQSSNGRMLFSVCKSINPDSYFISSPEEIDSSWFKGKKSVGICGATSTPKWLIENVRDYILNI